MKNHILLACVFLVFALTVSCNVAQKAMRSGQYDKAIVKSVKKLRKNPSKEKYVLILEQSFAKAQKRDQEKITFLKKEGRPENWVDIFEIYDRMNDRQNLIRPLLPLNIPSENRKAEFEFKNYTDMALQAKRKAADYLFAHAKKLLDENNRHSARQAYLELRKLEEYYPEYEGLNDLIDEALFKGTNKVLFDMKNTTGVPLPPAFERELTKISLHELNQQWVRYYTTETDDVYFDYEIIVKLDQISVSPEQNEQVQYKEEKKVEDGWEYVLDENGNVKKDTAGNDIKVKKYKVLTCFVSENTQRKVARISGTVDYHDKRSGQLIGSYPVTSDAVFEHHYATALGDLKALKPETKKKLNYQPVPYPDDFTLLLQAGETLRPLVKDVIWDHKRLVLD